MLYAGIDEAGYGPVLGPLCVGFVALSLENWKDGEAAPDVWSMLRPSVSKEPSKAGSRVQRIAVNDSKALKGSNSLKTRHPLTHLERGVLAFLSCLDAEGELAGDDAGLFERLGAALEPEWYGGEAVPLPLSTTRDHLSLLAAPVRGACERAGVRVVEVRAHAMCERTFNERLRSAVGDSGDPGERPGLASKASVSFGVVAGFLRRVWKSQACLGGGAEKPLPRVVVDRQGGRTAYAGVLNRAFPDALVSVVGESAARSVYELRGLGESDGRAMRVIFQMEAEAAHFPVALASMTAKLVRELAMARFNRYWGARIAELKPTAGYAQDGERWLSDVRAHLSADQRAALRRLA